MKLPASEAVAALGASVVGELPPYLECAIDTRALRAGQTYVVVRGERFDGHDFLSQAKAAGAVAAVVERTDALPPGLTAIVVEDVEAAFYRLASLAREHFCGATVAITGSAGKTTTKEFLHHILRGVTSQPVYASPANENNEIGVAKVLLKIESEAAAVIEMGARHYGDIAILTALARPHVGVITNIGEAHVEIFGSAERLAETKWQILGLGAQAVLHLHDTESRARAPKLSKAPYYFAVEDPLASDAPESRADGMQSEAALPDAYTALVTLDAQALYIRKPGRAREIYPIDAVVPGRHNSANLAAACAAAIAIGFAPAAVAKAVHGVAQPPGRYERRTGKRGISVIHDAYNASPGGTLASLDAFANEPAQRRILVFGSMAELGERAPAAHREIGAAIAQAGVDAVFLGGRFAADVESGATVAGYAPSRIHRYATNPELIDVLQEFVGPGDAVLVKGSRMYRLEEIVEALTAGEA